MLPIKLLVIQ